MDAQLRAMLNESEQELLRAAEPRELKRLDEDELAALHDRIRRARNKYSKLYRRRASSQVSTDRARERAHAAHVKAARKAEGFEDALARVSRRLADLAEVAAAELKAERLAAASKSKTTPRSSARHERTVAVVDDARNEDAGNREAACVDQSVEQAEPSCTATAETDSARHWSGTRTHVSVRVRWAVALGRDDIARVSREGT